MAEFKYEALDQAGKAAGGTVNAASQDAAIAVLQRKGLTITSITGGGEKTVLQQMQEVTFFGGVSSRDLVLLSRQIATLFEAQVSALRVFRLLAEQGVEGKKAEEHLKEYFKVKALRDVSKSAASQLIELADNAVAGGARESQRGDERCKPDDDAENG